MKKYSLPLNNELADELSWQIAETRARKSGVNFSRMTRDPALRPYFKAAEKAKKRLRPKLNISQATIDRLAGY